MKKFYKECRECKQGNWCVGIVTEKSKIEWFCEKDFRKEIAKRLGVSDSPPTEYELKLLEKVRERRRNNGGQ